MGPIDNNRYRRARFKRFLDGLPESIRSKDPIRILDIGGTLSYWQSMQDLWSTLPLDVTVINLGAQPCDEGPLHLQPGDACNLSDFPDNSFDIVHSNSVIEHVGGWRNMARMAAEIGRVAPHYFVQTPNFWFPYEPHYRTPFFQFLPEPVRARMLRGRKRGFRGPYTTLGAAMHDVQTVSLIDAHLLGELFPEAEIEPERAFLLVKSLIARR